MKKRERGASLVEYALLVAMLSIASIAAVRSVGQKVSQQFSTAGDSLTCYSPDDLNPSCADPKPDLRSD